MVTYTEQEKRKEEQQKEEEKNRKEKEPVDYCPPRPIYDQTYKEDPLPNCDPKEKEILDPHYYPRTMNQIRKKIFQPLQTI